MTEKQFPEKWYLNFTEEQRPIVDNWRINIIEFSTSPCPSNYINFFGQGWIWGGLRWEGEEITFEEFYKYVLNKSQVPQAPEDLSYLIPLLESNNII